MNVKLRGILSTLGVCLGASVLAAILKIIYGRNSGSLAFVADGVHSLFDSLATVSGMVSVIFSTKPPDEGHPYGHYKIETLSAIGLGLLLFVAAYEVGHMAFVSILTRAAAPTVSLWGLGVLGVTMAINLGVARFEARRAKDLNSPFLAADSLHNQSDFLITIAILVTMISAHFRIPYVDAIASILICTYLVYLASRLISFNIRPLVDHSVLDPKEVESVANQVDGVLHCHHIRSRGEDGRHFLDLNLHLPGQITLERAHEISHQVEERLREAFPGLIDVVIHTEPHGHASCSVENKDDQKS